MSANPYAVRQAVYAALASGTALAAQVGTRIYHGTAPASASYPFVTFAQQGDAPQLLTHGNAEAWVDYPWLVRAIGETAKAAEDAYHAAHAVLGTAALSASGVTVIACTRSSVVAFPETEPSDGTVLHHVGGVYHVLARE